MILFGSASRIATSLGLGTLRCGDACSEASLLGTNTGFPILLSCLKLVEWCAEQIRADQSRRG